MKTTLIPFNAEKAKNGAKVVTRNGLPVKIVDYPVKNEDCPILGLILIEGKEFPKLFTKNGNHYSDCTESRLDLFIEEEEVEEDDSDYDPYKEVVESIMDMVERYSPNNVGSLQDFYHNVKVKCRETIEYYNTWNKKQEEQKTSDNKPKFQVGDWIVQENVGVYKVTEIWDSWYEVIDFDGSNYSISFDQEYMCHLWTIQDAKPGDVLHAVGQHTYCIFIFNRLDNDVSDRDRVFATGYCCLDITADKMEFGVQGPDSIEVGTATVKPATKIQCDLLFQKMKESRYEWDSDKKELIHIKEQDTPFKIIPDKWYVCTRLTYSVDDRICFQKDFKYLGADILKYDLGFVDWEYSFYFRPWTIQDAKPGDKLFHSDTASNGIFIFKEIAQDGEVVCYCDYDSEDGFCLGRNHTCCWADSKILHPATKEQCDLLFQKMKEAGYDWFPNIKEIHKIGKEEVKTRRMTHQELADWLRDAPEEHREYRYAGDKDVYNTYDYPETEAKTPVEENRITIRRNHGEWQEPLIEE